VDVLGIPLWLSLRVNEFTGIPIDALTEAIYRLGEGRGLVGDLPVSLVEKHGWRHIDLSYIAAPLHDLDRDGTTARLWRELCKKWPIVRDCYHELYPGEGGATGDAATGANVSVQIRLPPDPVADVLPASSTQTLVLQHLPDGAAAGTTPAKQPADAPTSAGCIRQCGANWEIRYGTEQGSFSVKDYSALSTLAKLLTRPHHSFKLTDLVDSEAREHLEKPEAQERVLDNQALVEIKQRYEELKHSPAPDDPVAEQKHREEMMHLAEELRKAIGPGGRMKALGRSNRDRAWDAMTKDLRRLWRRLEDGKMPQLAAHLKDSIHIDRPQITYHPSPGTALWEVEGAG
jgi:hypothetical protein